MGVRGVYGGMGASEMSVGGEMVGSEMNAGGM